MSKFAYLDEYGILHILDKETAEQYHHGHEPIETEVEASGEGYPVVYLDGQPHELIIYTEGGNITGKVDNAHGYPVSVSNFPAIHSLVSQLLG